MLLTALLTLMTLLFGYRLLRFFTNYLEARRIGLPIVITPFTWQDSFWILFGPRFSWIRCLPFGLGSWYKYSYMGWTLHDRYRTYARLGTKAITVVSPGRNEIMLGDADAITEVAGRYKKWNRPRQLYKVFATFGENVDSVNGDNWQRHRKVTGHGFREHNNKLVWESATKQAREWMATWDSPNSERSMKIIEEDINTIAMNVLMFASFGQDYGFVDGGTKDIPSGHTKSFREIMPFMLKNVGLAWATRSFTLPKMLEPKSLATLRETKNELFQYFDESLRKADGDFVKSFVEANENEKKGGRQHLTKDELFGNMYMIQLAGFDTTSNAMLLTMALLATHPEVQEWIFEELGQVEAYEDTYPAAIRCRAAMHETLRMYSTAPGIVRHSSNIETINIGGKRVIVPAETFVSVNFTGHHHDPDVWGPDVHDWKPQRWVETVDGKEQFKQSPDVLAWSIGPRICPGKKFSQVEYTAVVSTLLRQYRFEASASLHDAFNDFKFVVAPKIKRPIIDAASIKFIRRQTKSV